jgi:hypothetical protein
MADPQNPLAAQNAQFSTAPQPLTVEYVPGHVKMYHLSEERIDAISGCGDRLGICLTFFGISIGALVSWGGILWFTPPNDAKNYAVVVALTVVFGFGTVVFAVFGGSEFLARRRKLKNLSSGQAS